MTASSSTSPLPQLNVMCGICAEFYKPSDRVSTNTRCGHIFHEHCLLRWLSKSTTCPQCRHSCNRHSIHRIYFNFGERSDADGDFEGTDDPEDAMYWCFLQPPTQPGGVEEAPPDALKVGTDPDGNDAYVARVYLNDDLLPAMYVPQRGGAYAPWNCQGHFLRDQVEVLTRCDNAAWVAASHGDVPPNALPTGYSELGEVLYTGRAQYEGITLLGKVHPSHHVMYMAYQGQEVNTHQYEVLVREPKAKPTEPSEQEAPVQEAPAHEAPAQEAPVQDAPNP